MCCLRGGLCWWVKQKQETLDAQQRLDLFRDIFQSWSERIRSATLNEEEWHAFGKCEARGSNCWATDYSRQCTSHVLEGSRREYLACGNTIAQHTEEHKAFTRQRMLGTSTAMTRRRCKKVGFRLKSLKITIKKKEIHKNLQHRCAVCTVL